MHPEQAVTAPVDPLAGAVSDDGASPAAGVGEPDPAPPDLPAEEPLASDHVARIDLSLAAIARQMGLESERAAFRERIIDRLHGDIERMRATERSGLLRPVVTDLCRLRNDLLRQAGTVPAEMTAAQVAALLASFADVVGDALERCGVGVLSTSSGASFEPGRHQVVGRVEKDEPALDGTVAAVIADGYAEIDSGKVVVPARVTVHRYVPSRTDETASEEQRND